MSIEQTRANIRNKLAKKKRNIEEAAKRRNSKWNTYYQNRQWKQLRQWKIINNPICENCAHFGIITPADEVHHLKVFGAGTTEDEKYRLLLDPLNLRSLCSHCHDLYHNEMRRLHITEYSDYIDPNIQTEFK